MRTPVVLRAFHRAILSCFSKPENVSKPCFFQCAVFLKNPFSFQKHSLLLTHPKTHAKHFLKGLKSVQHYRSSCATTVQRAQNIYSARYGSYGARYTRYSAHYHPVISLMLVTTTSDSHCFSHAGLWSSAPAAAGAVSPSSCALGSPSGVGLCGASSSFGAAPSPSVVSPSCGAGSLVPLLLVVGLVVFFLCSCCWGWCLFFFRRCS